MYNNILLPVDMEHTVESSRALKIAVEEARRSKAKLTVMTVAPGFGSPLVASYFDGEGMSTLAIGGLVFPGFNGVTGAAEESSGYMLQGQYTMGSTRFAVNWSASEQEQVTLVENEKLTLGVYHNLTPSLTLVGEFSDQESTLSGVGTDESWNVNLGAIMFF